LKFFRLAFGAAGGFGDQIDTREARAALDGLFGADKRVELGWMVEDDELSKGAVKLLLNLALIAGDAWCAAAGSTLASSAATASWSWLSVPKVRESCLIQRSARRSSRAAPTGPSSRALQGPGWRMNWRIRREAKSAVEPGRRSAADRRYSSRTRITRH
jgi:hypothetical protein